MIKINGEVLDLTKFKDGTFWLKKITPLNTPINILWVFESNDELTALIFITKHLRSNTDEKINLLMPYVPNARQDRVRNPEDVFTMKYFSEVINFLKFNSVKILDPHSNVAAALIDKVQVKSAKEFIEKTVADIETKYNTKLQFFYPDAGSKSRYAPLGNFHGGFVIKVRDWSSGKIVKFDVFDSPDKGRDVLIIDDIMSRGSTMANSAAYLKNEVGVNRIFLCVTHCENTIVNNKNSFIYTKPDLIEKIYTTNSLFTSSHEKIEVVDILSTF